MPTTNRIFPLILLPTTSEEGFDQYLSEEFATYVWPDGRSHSVLKATKGDRLPQYLLIWQIEPEWIDLSSEEQNEIHGKNSRKNPNNDKIVEKLLTLVEYIFEDGDDVKYERSVEYEQLVW